MNKANKITVSRIILAMIIILLLVFPFHEVGIDFPTYLVNGKVVVDIKYIIAGILFVIASLTDFLDGYVSKKYNMATAFGIILDRLSDKILTNSILIIIACDGKISIIIPIVIIIRDLIVDTLKLTVATKGYSLGTLYLSKIKTAILMVGIAMVLFYNLPFELISFRVSSYLLAVAAIMAVISGIKYYLVSKPYLK